MNIIRIVFAENNSCYNKRYFKVTKKKLYIWNLKKYAIKPLFLLKNSTSIKGKNDAIMKLPVTKEMNVNKSQNTDTH